MIFYPFIPRLTKFSFNLIQYLVIILMILSLSSCVSTKKATYFNNIPNSKFITNIEDLEPVIGENDLLSISVSSLNPEAVKMFNTSNLTTTGALSQASGYLVDQEGYIRFPFLGKIKAAGKIKKNLREEITAELVSRKLLLEPIVDIRYLNYKISVLGEVRNPSVITIPNEKVTLLEALGLAGDLTIYAKRDNVLLIRDEAGVRRLTRIDLTTDDIFTSPFYYLKNNDIIYVEPNKSKVASTSRTTQWLPVVLGTLSLGVVAIASFIN